MNFDLGDAVRELKGEKLSQSFSDFFRMFWGVNSNDVLSYNWHIDYLCERLSDTFYNFLSDKERYKNIQIEKNQHEAKYGEGTYEMKEFNRTTKHLLINIPPRSSKSLIASVNFPVWAWTKDKTLKFICVSFNETLALFLAHQSMKIIRSRKFIDLFGKKVFFGDHTAVGNFDLGSSEKKDEAVGFRKSIGIGGTVTGTGGDFIIIDDPIKPGDADERISDKGLEACKKWYDETLSSRLNNPSYGIIIVIMQRLHEKDLSGHILESISSGTYEHICCPMEINSTYSVVRPLALREKYRDGLLWPDRYPKKILTDLKNRMGEAYYGQMNQVPVNPEGAIIKHDWLRATDHIPEACGRNLIFLDPAYTEDKHNNPTGILVCTVDYHSASEGSDVSKYGSIYVLLAEEVYLEFHRLRDHILRLVGEFTKKGEPPIIYVEPKASGKSVYQGLKKSIPTVPVFEIKGDIVDRKDKRGRLAACSVQIQNGNLIFLKDSTTDDKKNWNKILEHQLCTFPYSRNDDLVDCISYAFYMTHKGRQITVGALDLSPYKEKPVDREDDRNGEIISLSPPKNEKEVYKDTTIEDAIKNAMGKPDDANRFFLKYRNNSLNI